jgi:hypothetical protein
MTMTSAIREGSGPKSGEGGKLVTLFFTYSPMFLLNVKKIDPQETKLKTYFLVFLFFMASLQ